MVIKFNVTPDQMEDEVSVADRLSMQEGNERALIRVMAMFAVNEKGEPISPELAQKEILALSNRQYRALVNDFRTQLKEQAVPLESEQG